MPIDEAKPKPIDEATIQALKAKHGEVHLVSAKSGEQVVLRVPSDSEWGSFIDLREKTGARALKWLVISSAVHPDAVEVRKLLEARPGLQQIFGARAMEVAGMAEEAELKKL
jgi:hypothetical protein